MVQKNAGSAYGLRSFAAKKSTNLKIL